jgi:hypothetical protein
MILRIRDRRVFRRQANLCQNIPFWKPLTIKGYKRKYFLTYWHVFIKEKMIELSFVRHEYHFRKIETSDGNWFNYREPCSHEAKVRFSRIKAIKYEES